MESPFANPSLPILPSFRKQQLSLEFASLKHHCPEGIYLTLNANDSASWLGAYFVREGAYAPAVLRFEIIFPARYPEIAPNVIFSSEIFHPLLVPLTTYTFSAGAIDPSTTISASESDRLLPGSLSLTYGFPQWNTLPGKARSASGVLDDTDPFVDTKKTSTREPEHSHTTVPIDKKMPPTVAVLLYIKSVFEDADVLDRLPLEAAGNPSAWHAWRSHRGLPKQGSRSSSPVNGSIRGTASSRNPADWNWDGLWEARVRTGIEESISDAQLFGSKTVRNVTTVNDPIRFVRLDDEKLEAIQTDMLNLHGFAQTPITR